LEVPRFFKEIKYRLNMSIAKILLLAVVCLAIGASAHNSCPYSKGKGGPSLLSFLYFKVNIFNCILNLILYKRLPMKLEAKVVVLTHR